MSKNRFIPIVCSMLYYFIFYSYGFYFISHPTFSDIGSSAMSQEMLSTISHIGTPFEWPVHFLFSKIFSTILGISTLLTINLGFIALISIFPIFIIIFFKFKDKNKNVDLYFLIPALYLILSYYFLNDQFAPQFLALMFLIILFGVYLKFQETRSRLFFILTIVFYILTVFTHAFMYIFFLITIIFEKIWGIYIENSKISKAISLEMIILLFTIPFTYLAIYLNEFTRVSVGESWRIFDYIYSQRTPLNGIETQPLTHLVPDFLNDSLSLISKAFVVVAFIIVVTGFIFYYLKKKGLFDLSIIAGSFIWFILGLSKMVLGQRALQVTPLALSSYYTGSKKIFSYFSIIIIVIVIISPSIFIGNTMINESNGGERLVQDLQENIAGKFIDYHLANESYVLAAQNAYPTCIKYNSRRVGLLSIISELYQPQTIDFIIDSPKFNLRLMYLNYTLNITTQNEVIYNTNNVKIIPV
jgi:hypothetical protein